MESKNNQLYQIELKC